MWIFLFIVEAIGLCLGSLAAGVLSCWLLWTIFKLVRHPELGPLLLVVPVILGVMGKLPASEFLNMSLVFGSVAAIPFWSAGREWRAARRARDVVAAPEAPLQIEAIAGRDAVPAPPYLYPAITACMCEGRPAARDEVKKVALRIWRESFVPRSPNASFAVRRALWRAARASLEGS